MQTIEAIAKRYSVRSYEAKSVPEDLLNIVLTAGCAAPVGNGSYQSMHITVVESPEMMKKLPTPALYGAPVFILLSGLKDDKMHDINFANAGCILENMMLAAADLGLGSVYEWAPISAITSNQTLCEELGIPEGFQPISGLALGYSKEEKAPKELSMRIVCNRI